jgi:hypothetical protein
MAVTLNRAGNSAAVSASMPAGCRPYLSWAQGFARSNRAVPTTFQRFYNLPAGTLDAWCQLVSRFGLRPTAPPVIVSPMPKQQMDILILDEVVSTLEPLAGVLRIFKALYVRETAPGTCLAQGQLQDTNSPFGPVLQLHDKHGRNMSVRIPWQWIRAVISGQSIKDFGFSSQAEG